jgi:predicted phosphodiesterase
MRWGVVSDIHGNLPALEAVLDDGRGRVDAWLNLGDTVSGPLWPRETADRLMALGWPTIAGNHERQLLTLPRERMSPADAFAAAALDEAHRAWLASLPARMAPAPGLECVHGTPASDLKYLLQTVEPAGLREARDDEVRRRVGDLAASLLLCGHTHLPRVRRLGPMTVANPGSVGLPAYDDDNGFPHLVENGTPEARYAIAADDGAGRWTVELRPVAYDHEAAARRAEAHGRGDWADALRTGRVGRRERDVVASR